MTSKNKDGTYTQPSYQHIWECDAEFFSVGGEAFRDDVEEEALDAEEEKKEAVQLCQTHLIQEGQ